MKVTMWRVQSPTARVQNFMMCGKGCTVSRKLFVVGYAPTLVVGSLATALSTDSTATGALRPSGIRLYHYCRWWAVLLWNEALMYSSSLVPLNPQS